MLPVMGRDAHRPGAGPALRLGVIGLSPGNGHPYSWSAIINGYDPAAMARCPFPAIPAYLAERSWPADRLAGARVTHVWTQERAISTAIARAALIDHVVAEPGEMLGEVDGLLLARDDAASHLDLARPFLAAGLPVYVDKPLETSVAGAKALLGEAVRPGQVFSCSALRYATELALTAATRERIGDLVAGEARSPKAWDTYAAHAIEPVVAWLPGAELLEVAAQRAGARTTVSALLGSVRARFVTTGDDHGVIEFDVQGTRGSVRLVFEDSFTAFRSALAAFLQQVRSGSDQIAREQTLTVVRLIEAGAHA